MGIDVFKLLVICASFIATASPVVAYDVHIACVQSQLKTAGYEPGPVDGLVGRRTRAALSEFLRARSLDETMPLESVTASATCRRIGMAQPELKELWPSRSATVEVDIAKSVAPSLARDLRIFARDVHRDVLERFDAEVAGTDRVVIGTTPGEIKDLIARSVSYEVFELSDALREDCASDWNMFGSNTPNLVSVCVKPDAQIGSDISLTWARYFFAREFTYLFQHQVSGSLPRYSQPWPYPASLMMGCAGDALSDEITVDPVEIEDALWMSREEMIEVFAGTHAEMREPRKGAIAHSLLWAWLRDEAR